MTNAKIILNVPIDRAEEAIRALMFSIERDNFIYGSSLMGCSDPDAQDFAVFKNRAGYFVYLRRNIQRKGGPDDV